MQWNFQGLIFGKWVAATAHSRTQSSKIEYTFMFDHTLNPSYFLNRYTGNLIHVKRFAVYPSTSPTSVDHILKIYPKILNAPNQQKWTKFIQKWTIFMFHFIIPRMSQKRNAFQGTRRIIFIRLSPAEFAQPLLGHHVFISGMKLLVSSVVKIRHFLGNSNSVSCCTAKFPIRNITNISFIRITLSQNFFTTKYTTEYAWNQDNT